MVRLAITDTTQSDYESCPVRCPMNRKWLPPMEDTILKEPFQPVRAVLLIANGGLLWRTPFLKHPTANRRSEQHGESYFSVTPPVHLVECNPDHDAGGLVSQWGSAIKLTWVCTVKSQYTSYDAICCQGGKLQQPTIQICKMKICLNTALQH